MASLFILEGPTHRGETIPLSGARCLIGRNPECDLCLPNAAISRAHARIEQIEGKFYIEDLESSNGCFVNGTRITSRTLLRNNDQIRLANYVAAFVEDRRRGYWGSARAEELYKTLAEGSEEDAG